MAKKLPTTVPVQLAEQQSHRRDEPSNLDIADQRTGRHVTIHRRDADDGLEAVFSPRGRYEVYPRSVAGEIYTLMASGHILWRLG